MAYFLVSTSGEYKLEKYGDDISSETAQINGWIPMTAEDVAAWRSVKNEAEKTKIIKAKGGQPIIVEKKSKIVAPSVEVATEQTESKSKK